MLKAKKIAELIEIAEQIGIKNLKGQKVEDLGNYKLLTAKMGNLTIKSKINRETEVPSHNVKLHIPAEKCCVYDDNKLI